MPARPPLPAAVETATARAFETAARWRRARALHPRGDTFRGTAALTPVGSALGDRAEIAVVVRLSRGIGLPHPVPDFNGIAIRFQDAHGRGRHQDLLLTSALAAPVLRHVLRPAATFAAAGHTTVLPYRRPGGGRIMFRCPPMALERLDDGAAALPFPIALDVATLLGPWERAADLVVTAPEPDAGPRFDPWNTGDQLIPSGLLNRLRGPAYAGSRAGYPAAPVRAKDAHHSGR